MNRNITGRLVSRSLRKVAMFALASGCMVTAANANPPASTPTKIFIVNRMDSTVALVDLTTMKQLHEIHVGALPYYVALSGDQKTLAVSVEGEEKIKFYDSKTYALKGEYHLGKMYAEHMVTTPDGNHIVVANRYGDAVVGINLTTMKEEFRVPVSSPHNLRLGASGKYLYVNCKINPGIAVVDLEKRAVKSFYPEKFVPRGLAVSLDEKTIYAGANWVNGMFEIDAATGKLNRFDQLPLPTGKKSVEESTYHGFEPVNSDVILGTNEGLSALDVIDAKTGQLINRSTNVSNPGAILMIPGMKNRFIVTNMGNNTIDVMEIVNNHDLKSISTMSVGHQIGDLPKRFVYFYD